MKKWMYLIFPGLMLGLFLFFYLAASKETELKEKQHIAAAAKLKADEAARKKIIEDKARLDSEKRSAARAAEEKKKEDDKIAKWVNDGKKIQDDTDKANAEANRLSKEAAVLEIQLDTLRKAKDKASREAFELVKQVELAKVARRNAEIEIQRTTEMISRRAAESSLVKPPLVPATPGS